MYGLTEIIEFVRSYGLRDLLRAAVRRYVFRHEKQIVSVASLDEPIHEMYLRMDEVAIREAAPEDVEELHALLVEHRWPRTRKQLREWLSGDNACAVAVDNGRIVGYGCVTRELSSRDPLLTKGIMQAVDFGEDDVWTADAFVAASHRATGVYPAISAETRKVARRLGARRVVGTISSGNVLSRRVHRKLGCTEVGELTFQRFLFFTKVTFTPIP